MNGLLLRLGHDYVHAVLGDLEAKAVYAAEAAKRKMRTCDLVMSDFMLDPVITVVDATKYNGLAGGWLLVMTGDDFKVTQVRVIFRNAAGQRLEDELAVRAKGDSARVWIYTAKENLTAGQTITIEVTATDRAGHSSSVSSPHPI
jgi:hypothetical protein